MPLFNPNDGLYAGGVGQSTFVELSANTTTTSLTFVNALSTNVDLTIDGYLLLDFSCSVSNTSNNQTMFFRLRNNTTALRGTATRVASGAGNPQVVSLTYRTGLLSAGTYTIDVQWRTTGGTVQVRPVAAPDQEHMCLVITPQYN